MEYRWTIRSRNDQIQIKNVDMVFESVVSILIKFLISSELFILILLPSFSFRVLHIYILLRGRLNAIVQIFLSFIKISSFVEPVVSILIKFLISSALFILILLPSFSFRVTYLHFAARSVECHCSTILSFIKISSFVEPCSLLRLEVVAEIITKKMLFFVDVQN